jgi:hypothetical protein
MRERATASGGTIDIGRASDGRYVVRTRVPVAATPAPTPDDGRPDEHPTIDATAASRDGDSR